MDSDDLASGPGAERPVDRQIGRLGVRRQADESRHEILADPIHRTWPAGPRRPDVHRPR